jgi:hypothetical protein
VVHLARELAHLLGQPREVGQRIEVARLELRDPGVDPLLHVLHGQLGAPT